MGQEVHIRSDELCERCAFGACGHKCSGCELDRGMLCACDEVQVGTPCEHFREVMDA
ncbi:MAG: hypothetical protein SOX74_04800 [Candidatus Faecousia sp.]|uniref:hypothetical protein n=1 Tax=Faecousia sp. TaxID=2952921 RepID=UPI002A8D4889|nr:hypothetical protein [Candidatus Faecousia sp.]